jgi:prepilin signal peptidase PulO-like enzyme (type II secretory pathway)
VKKRSIQLVSASFLIVGLSRAFIFLNINLLLVIPVLLVFAFLPKKIEWTIAVPLFGYALYSGWENALFNFVGVYIPLFLIYFIIRLYLISRKYILKKTIKISELKEGDIPADTFVQDPQTGKIEVSEKLSIGSVINHLRNNTLKNALANKRQGWRVIADSMSAAGLENTQVDGLKNAAQEGKIKDEIEIKLSAPFVPAILIAYIVLQTIGDVFWIVLYHL